MNIRPQNLNQIRRGGISKYYAPLFGFIIVIVMVFLLIPDYCLTAESDEKLLFAFPIENGEFFEVNFTHSANLSPVTDVIEWTGTQMLVRKTIFKAFGAGIPVPSDGIGTELIHIDGHYELLGIDKPMQSFGLMTQTVPNHYIFFKERKISLLRLVGSGRLVNITVKPVSRIKRLMCGFS